MLSYYLKRVIIRDLNALREQVRAYPDENQIWEIPEGISNSGGTLALHLVGNLQHFIGAVLGQTAYVRDRPAEFDDRHIPRDEIEARVDDTIAAMSVLDGITDEDLERVYPLAFGDVHLETGQFLVHLTAHLAYHLGQLDYHRRLTTGINEPVGGNQIAALA